MRISQGIALRTVATVLLLFTSKTSSAVLFETFDTDTPNLAATLAAYPNFSYTGSGDAFVTAGQLHLTTSGRTFFFDTVGGGPLLIDADISKTPGGGSFNAGLVIGQNNLVFHPGYSGGAFRVEGPGGFGNQNMGFTPAAWPTMHHFNVAIRPTGGTNADIDIRVTDGSNPLNVFTASYTSTTYTTGDRIGFTVEGGYLNRGVFDNLSVVVPEPSTLLTWSLLAALGIGCGAYRRKR